jgi:hypothetical protein
MVNQIWSTEEQSQGQEHLSNGMYKRPYPSKNNQHVTDLQPHNGWVVQGLTDGHTAINSHEDEDKYLHAAK